MIEYSIRKKFASVQKLTKYHVPVHAYMHSHNDIQNDSCA